MSEISDILNALKFGQVHQLDIELTPEQSADLLTHIDDLHFAVNEQPELTARIAELEALVDELVNIGDNLFDSLNPIAWKHEWLDKWWKLSSCRRGEREE